MGDGGSTGYLLDVDYSALAQPNLLTLGAGGTDNKNLYVANDFEAGTGRLTRSFVTDQTHGYMLQDLNYTYDQTGNVTSISDPALLGGASSAETQCFAYDGHRRLIEAWTPSSQKCSDTRSASSLSGPAPYWTTYSYNDAGQRTGETIHKSTGDTKTTYCYSSTTQKHTLTGTTTKGDCASPERTYQYDSAGNSWQRPGKSGTQTLDWCTEGKLSKLTENGVAIDYLYAADGSLLIRNTQNGERVLYAGATELHLRANGTTWAQRYYGTGGTNAALRSNQTGTEKITHLTGDQHNTASLAVNRDTGQTFTKRYTTPFGADRGNPLYGPWPDDKGFLGQTRDATTGLTHIGAREYDPATGQFLSVDPLLQAEIPQTLNGYSYAAQNPLTYADPSGLGLACGGEGGTGEGCGTGNVTRGDGSLSKGGEPTGGGTSSGGTAVGWGSSGTASGNGSSTTANTTRPVVDGIIIPDKDQLYAMGYGGGYPDSASYADMLSRWAQSTCHIGDSVKAFCDTAQRAGLLRGNENDPWGVKATYHCLTRGDDCGEAVVSAVINIATLAFGSTGKSLTARGASPAVAAEAEAATATFLKAACSFTPDTPVLLKSGKTKAISEVNPGDEVAAADPDTGKRKGGKAVTDRFTHQDDDLVDVTVRTADGRTSVLHTTADHPFWNDTLQNWTAASELHSGHLLNTDNDRHVRVVDVTQRAGSAEMFNLTVDSLHTYYVLADETPILVHNSCPVLLGTKLGIERYVARNSGDFGVLNLAGTMNGVGKGGTKIIGAKGTGSWNWTRNKRFIDEALNSGTPIRLVTNPGKSLYTGGKVYQRELKCLMGKGHSWRQVGKYWKFYKVTP